MRVPLSWLREYAPVPEPVDAADVARRLTAAGLEVETVEQVGHDIRGVVIGQVLTVEELTEFKKPIRYCRVAVSEEELAGPPEKAAGVICGAVNFAAGDRIAYARPGAVLPGGFEIGARKTYGRISEGMICSAKELAIGEDHTGILVLPPDAPLGADFVAYAGLRDDVLEITVTPDRGYAVSIRGVARELATAYGVPFTDPAEALDLSADGPSDEVWPASIADPTACDRFVLREVRGFNARAASPLWMLVRLARCGVRGVSLAVDVTNYLMLELGQPLHAFDRSKLHGEIVVRRARPGEKLETLDHVNRALYPEDILITDGSGPISMAGTMGGLATEIDDDSTDIVIEGAHFDAVGTAKMSRRHRLHSEASYRFERGVDRELPPRATARAVALLAALGGGVIVPGYSEAAVPVEPVVIDMAADYPDRVAGVVYGLDTVVRRLTQVGCEVRSGFAAALPTIAPWRRAAPATTPRRGRGGRARGPRAAIPGAAGRAAVLAVGPDRPGGPRRGGHPPRGLRQRAGPDAAGAGRPRPDRAPAADPRDRPHARRRRFRGGERRAVRARHGGRQPVAAAGRPAAARGAGREPAQRRPAEPAHHPAARSLPRPGAEHRPRVPRHRPVRDGRGVPAAPRRAGRRADPGHRPRSHGRGAGRPGGGAARPAGARRRRAGRRPRAARLVGSGTGRDTGRTRSRRRARPARWAT